MSTALTGAAGEHFVAYQLSLRGFCVGLSRGGSPFVDIMIANHTGEGVAIQVKTSNGARRNYKRKPGNNRWEFDVGPKARTLGGERLFYAFVDLKRGAGVPDVFIVPSLRVRACFAGTFYVRSMYWIAASEQELWLNRWDYITGLLRPPLVDAPSSDEQVTQQINLLDSHERSRIHHP